MKEQIDINLYRSKKYCNIERWASYWHQINETLECKPKKMLEIGVGGGFLSSYVKINTDIEYLSLDVADNLEPDIVGSVDNMPLENDSFDLVCAFEVLEHLPFENFDKALKELSRVSKKNVIISLPHWGRHFSIEVRLPYFKKIRWQHKFNLFPIDHKFDGRHYWEIGKNGFPLKKIKRAIEDAGFIIERDYICFEFPYHHFFILKSPVIS